MDAESIEWKLTANLRNGPTFFQPLADSIEPLQFKLIGSDTVATAFPVFDTKYIPDSLINYLFKLFNLEIESGKTYPQLHSLTKQEFLNYWFHSFAVVVLQTMRNLFKIIKTGIQFSWAHSTSSPTMLRVARIIAMLAF